MDRREQCRLQDVLLVDPGQRRDGRRQPVAERDRAGLVEQDHVDVARGLHRPTAHRQDVEPRDAVHAGDADGREQPADRGGNQADEQRDQDHDAERRVGVDAERPQGRRRQQEHDREARQQDREGDLVRGALPLGALDERDHAVKEGVARIGGDPDREVSLVRVVPPVTDERMSVPGSLRTGRRLAGDDGLVDVGDALDDVAVAGDRLALADDDDVAGPQLAGPDVLERAVRAAPVRRRR